MRDADSRAEVERFLNRNEGLSVVARVGEQLAGLVMCGHDGRRRRGHLYHLLVVPAFRRRGLASLLLRYCLVGLKRHGIEKLHIDVLATNGPALEFWRASGWQRRDDLVRMSFTNSDDPKV